LRHPCAWHANLDRPKAAEELTLSGSVPVALGLAQRPLVAATTQGRSQFLFQQLLNEATNAFADADFDRIKPGLQHLRNVCAPGLVGPIDHHILSPVG
jgi:hypothetical protein